MRPTNGRGYRKLHVDGSHYIYDTATNAIVPVRKPVYRIIDNYFRLRSKDLWRKYSREFPPSVLRGAIASIRKAERQYGMFARFRKKDFTAILDRDWLRETLAHQLSQLILYVVDGCNQRCSYCWYRADNPERGAQRRSVMEWETARASIDYLSAHSSKSPRTSISFYGGEPLLVWPLVRRCVDYVRNVKRGRGQQPTLRLVTNLTLLSDSILDYLIANDVWLQVSLDGPKHIHDAGRMLPDGRGTWDCVVANLERIRRRNSSYFLERVNLNCTYSVEHSLMKVFDFFNAPPERDLLMTLGFRNSVGATGDGTRPAQLTRYGKDLTRLICRHLDALATDAPFNHGFVISLLDEVFGQVASRPIAPEAAQQHPNGICIPGRQRIFADCDGVFYPCEKCWLPGTAIGSARDGINMETVRRLLREWVDLCALQCQECWAYRLCRQCFVDVFEDGQMSGGRKKACCESMRFQTQKALERFVFMWNREHEGFVDRPFSLHSLVAQSKAAGTG